MKVSGSEGKPVHEEGAVSDVTRLLLLPEWIGSSIWNDSVSPKELLDEGDLGIPVDLLHRIDAWGYATLTAPLERQEELKREGKMLARELSAAMGPLFEVRIFGSPIRY